MSLRSRLGTDLTIGDHVLIRNPGNHHDGLQGFFCGISDDGHADVWHPYQMWRVAGDHKYPIVNAGTYTGWYPENLYPLDRGSLCSTCDEWFVGENEYLCPSCRP